MVLKVLFPSLTALGFYRGVNSYNYGYQKICKNYENLKNNGFNKPQYFYSDCIFSGLIGSFLYVNPITIFIVIPKELYRAEVNIRGLHEEKEKDNYYRLI